MADLTKLRVFHQARENLREINKICNRSKGFGDLHNQIKRAAISVVSNIAEGAGSGSTKQFIKFLGIARGSNNEITAQLLILSDIGSVTQDEALIENVNTVGKMLTAFIQYLRDR